MEKQSSYNIIISSKVEQKIRCLCSKLWNLEWSGILFYTSTGTFEDNTLEIKCQDLLVMDIGTSAFTEFTESPEVINYMVNNDLLDSYTGLIHSHNNMAAFFSNTDINTLKEEGNNTNHFVSLIVNNEGKYVAKITRKIKVLKNIKEKTSYNSFNNELIEKTNSYTEEKILLEDYDLNIVKEFLYASIDSEIENRLSEIRTLKEQEKLKTKSPSISFPDKFSQYTIPVLPKFDNYKNSSNIKNDSKVKKSFNTPINNINMEKYYEEDFQNFNYEELEFDKTAIKNSVLQLITGSIIITKDSNINLERWVSNMSTIYEKRFGKGELGLKAFDAWAEVLIEYLSWSTPDSTLEDTLGLDYSEIACIFSFHVIKELQKLQINPYIEIFIKHLKRYII